MKLRTTLLLVLLNALVFFFLLRQQSPFEIRSQMGLEETGILLRPMSEVIGIDVGGSSLEQAYALSLQEGRWQIEQPVQWDANAFAVRRMISQLESAEVSVRFPVSDIQNRQQTLADFGLADPNFILRLDYGGAVHEFAFGAPVEVNNQLYLLGPEKNEILVVRANLIQPFLLGMDALRSNTLFPVPVFEVRSLLVEFNDDNSRRRFTRDAGRWVMDTPFFAEASDERVQGAIHRLVNYEVDLSASIPGTDRFQEVTHFNAIARFEVIGNRRNSTLLVSRHLINGETHPSLYLARFEGSETTFLIPRGEIDWWRTSQSNLRERRFMDLDLASISKVEVVSGTEPPTTLRLLKLENSQWRIYSGQTSMELVDFLGDGPTVLRTLADLNDLIALAFVNDDPTPDELRAYGLESPALTITLEGAQLQRLQVGDPAEQEQRVYATLEGTESVYLIASEVLARMTLDPLAYRDRSVPLVAPGRDITGISIRDLRSGHVTELSNPESLRASAIQALSEEDAEGALAALRSILGDFRTDGFLDAEVSDSRLHYGGVAMELPFELRIADSPEGSPAASTLLLSRRLSGSEQYAWIAERDLVVKLPQHLVDVLHPLIFATTVPAEWAPPVVPATEQDVAPEEPDSTEAGTTDPAEIE